MVADLWKYPVIRGLSYLTVTVLIGWGVYSTRHAFYPFLLSFALAYMLNPLIDMLEKRGRKRVNAVISFFSLLVVFSVLGVLVIIPLLASQLGDLFQSIPEFAQTFLSTAIPWIEKTTGFTVPDSTESLFIQLKNADVLKSVKAETFSPLLTVITWASSNIMNLVTLVLNLVLIPLFTFYFLLEYPQLLSFIDQLFPPRLRPRVHYYAQEIDKALSSFVRGQVTVAGIMALLYSLGLLFAGTPMWLLIGVFSGAVSFIPYLGLLMGIVPGVLLALLEHGDLWHPFAVVVVFSVVQFLEGNFITPKIVGDTVGLHPLAVMLALLLAGNALGLFGLIIAVPSAAVLKVFAKEALKSYKESSFYSGKRED